MITLTLKGQYRILNNEEICDLYEISRNVVIKVKSRMLQWAGHTAHTGGQKYMWNYGDKISWKVATRKA
jgi:hypothetical protein